MCGNREPTPHTRPGRRPVSLTQSPQAPACLPSPGPPYALKGGPLPSALARLCLHHCSPAGAGAGGQSSLRASHLSFAPLVASWPAPPSTYAHWSPGRRGLSCLREQPVGQSGRGASREATVEAAGGRPFYPGSSGGPTAGQPRTRRPSHPSGRAPDTDSSAELEGTSEPG